MKRDTRVETCKRCGGEILVHPPYLWIQSTDKKWEFCSKACRYAKMKSLKAEVFSQDTR